MRNLQGGRLVLLITPPLLLLLPIGVLIFALERISRSLFFDQTARSFRNGGDTITVNGPTTTGSSNATDVDITIGRTNQTPTITILGICVLSYVVCAIGTFGTWELRKVEGTSRHQRAWGWLVLVANIIMIGASAGVLGYASSVQSSDGGWQRYEDVGRDDPFWTRETWACQIDKFFPSSGWAGSACGTAKAARFLLIALIVASLLTLVSLWVLVRERGGLKWLNGGKGRYGGFDNVYELQPTAPNGQYAFHPAPQWSPQPYQQWPPQAYQQWAPGPGQQWPQQPLQQAPQPSLSPGHNSDLKTGQGVVFR